jgi:hypothetical protein
MVKDTPMLFLEFFIAVHCNYFNNMFFISVPKVSKCISLISPISPATRRPTLSQLYRKNIMDNNLQPSAAVGPKTNH